MTEEAVTAVVNVGSPEDNVSLDEKLPTELEVGREAEADADPAEAGSTVVYSVTVVLLRWYEETFTAVVEDAKPFCETSALGCAYGDTVESTGVSPAPLIVVVVEEEYSEDAAMEPANCVTL